MKRLSFFFLFTFFVLSACTPQKEKQIDRTQKPNRWESIELPASLNHFIAEEFYAKHEEIISFLLMPEDTLLVTRFFTQKKNGIDYVGISFVGGSDGFFVPLFQKVSEDTLGILHYHLDLLISSDILRPLQTLLRKDGIHFTELESEQYFKELLHRRKNIWPQVRKQKTFWKYFQEVSQLDIDTREPFSVSLIVAPYHTISMLIEASDGTQWILSLCKEQDGNMIFYSSEIVLQELTSRDSKFLKKLLAEYGVWVK